MLYSTNINMYKIKSNKPTRIHNMIYLNYVHSFDKLFWLIIAIFGCKIVDLALFSYNSFIHVHIDVSIIQMKTKITCKKEPHVLFFFFVFSCVVFVFWVLFILRRLCFLLFFKRGFLCISPSVIWMYIHIHMLLPVLCLFCPV